MSLKTLFSVWGVALFLAVVACAVIVRPLLTVLTDLCGGRERAQFWTVYACALTVATPLLVVSTPGLLDHAAVAEGSGPVLQRTVFYALAGIVVALLVMGRAVWRPIARMLQAPPAGHRGETHS
ncbi:hypothetical protein [Azospirillum sp. Marseille-Q6669]